MKIKTTAIFTGIALLMFSMLSLASIENTKSKNVKVDTASEKVKSVNEPAGGFISADKL